MYSCVHCMCVYHCPDVFACTMCLCMFNYHCPDVLVCTLCMCMYHCPDVFVCTLYVCLCIIVLMYSYVHCQYYHKLNGVVEYPVRVYNQYHNITLFCCH